MSRAETVTITLPSRERPAPTRRACEAARLLGMTLEDTRPAAPARTLTLPLRPLTLVTGPSGAGKTTLLRAIRAALRDRGQRTIDPDALPLRNAPCVDLFSVHTARHGSAGFAADPCRVRHHVPNDRPLDGNGRGPAYAGSIVEGVTRAMAALSRAGLAEAACFIRRPTELSTGQLARLRLALALHRADGHAADGAPAALFVDDFGAALDPVTRRTLAVLLRRAVDARPALRAIVAAGDDGVGRWLAPDTTVQVRAHEATSITIAHSEAPPARPDPLTGVVIEPAPYASYANLAGFHYRARRPARPLLTLVARDRAAGGRSPIAALVVARPTLNGGVRRLAWPGRFSSGDKARDARRLNDELRTIARVVVDPRWRALGVAALLVRAYLSDPLTPCTEAEAAMGRCCAFFERAGMTPYALPRAPRDARLLDALAHAGVEPWRLATPRAAWDRAVRAVGEPFLARELRRWAGDSRSTARRKRDDPGVIFSLACAVLPANPIGYAHTHTPAP